MRLLVVRSPCVQVSAGSSWPRTRPLMPFWSAQGSCWAPQHSFEHAVSLFWQLCVDEVVGSCVPSKPDEPLLLLSDVQRSDFEHCQRRKVEDFRTMNIPSVNPRWWRGDIWGQVYNVVLRFLYMNHVGIYNSKVGSASLLGWGLLNSLHLCKEYILNMIQK